MQKITFLRSASAVDSFPKRKEQCSSSSSKGTVCGFLHKEGPHTFSLGSAKRRWFSLEGVDLVYYNQPGDKKSLGFIHIPDIVKIYHKTDRCFVLVTPKRDWVLYANTKQRMEYWIQAIESLIVGKKARTGSSQPNIVSPNFRAPMPKINPQASEKAVRFSPRPQPLRGLPRTKGDGVFHSKFVFIEREKVKLKKLRANKEIKENEEMKLLLKVLQIQKPFPAEDIKKQSELEEQISMLDKQIVNSEAAIAVANTELQLGISGANALSDRRRRRGALVDKSSTDRYPVKNSSSQS